MVIFLLGFLACWVVVSVLITWFDTKNWVCVFEDWAGYILTLPLLAVIFPFCLIYWFLIRPWRNFWKPVNRERFEWTRNNAADGDWQISLFGHPRWYICYEKKAKLVNKLYFVRIKKGT